MRHLNSISDMSAEARRLRASGVSLGFVPTMGALHEGHLSLIDAARGECDHVVASIFVNPLQFAPNEDLERYPRDLEGDRSLLAEHGCDTLFTTSAAEMYPPGYATYVVQEGLSQMLEGASRPTHFRGVLTVVLKLLNLVAPERVYLGRKDYQQSVVVRRMVRDLALDVEVCVRPTVREPDGLAMSSRNRYLGPAERRSGLKLSAALAEAAGRFAAGERAPAALEAAMSAILGADAGVRTDYAVAVHPDTLERVDPLPEGAVALVAARVGATRLIDNVLLAAPDPALLTGAGA